MPLISRIRLLPSVVAALIVAVATVPSPSFAQNPPVELRSPDGKIAVKGNLLAIEGSVYVLDTVMGRLRIDSASVECIGIICPVIDDVEPEFGIYGSRTVGTTLIPNLLRGYAKSIQASYELVETGEDAERKVILTKADGELLVEIDLQTRGSGSAFPALAERVADIGLADRRMKDSDLAKMAAAGIPELRGTANEQVLGVDGITVITHPDNPVRNLTTEELARIWSGEITNWLELGGGNYPIEVNSFGEGSGDRAIFLDQIVRPNGREETAFVNRFGPYQDMVDAVIADRGGIGFVGRWLALTNNVNILSIREQCGLLSPPTDFRMKIEGYALSRRLYAYTRPGSIHPEARAFLDWVRTPEAQPYIDEAGFIDRELERMRLEDMGMMLIHTAAVEPDFDGFQYSEMMRELRNADRLSISFRFLTGSSTLDSESIRSLRELGARMSAGEFDGLEVMLVGFADSVGNSGQNTALAARRAESVRNLLTSELPNEVVNRLRLTPLSYGELLPLSCNDSDIGRERNRRVEVWLRVPGN